MSDAQEERNNPQGEYVPQSPQTGETLTPALYLDALNSLRDRGVLSDSDTRAMEEHIASEFTATELHTQITFDPQRILTNILGRFTQVGVDRRAQLEYAAAVNNALQNEFVFQVIQDWRGSTVIQATRKTR
jgi:hypothetical protein